MVLIGYHAKAKSVFLNGQHCLEIQFVWGFQESILWNLARYHCISYCPPLTLQHELNGCMFYVSGSGGTCTISLTAPCTHASPYSNTLSCWKRATRSWRTLCERCRQWVHTSFSLSFSTPMAFFPSVMPADVLLTFFHFSVFLSLCNPPICLILPPSILLLSHMAWAFHIHCSSEFWKHCF